MASINENIRQLEELLAKEGEGNLLVCYETDRSKPHAESSYRLYPVDKERPVMTTRFLTLLHVGVETARISAFIPDTRMEIYTFSRMSDLPPFSRNIPVKEYITGMLLPHIMKNGLKPMVSVNLRDMAFIRSEGLSVESGGLLRLNAGQIDRLVEFRRRQDDLAERYEYIPEYKLPLHVIETSRGTLVFSDHEIGRKGVNAFYQHLADNYFSEYGEKGPVRQYDVHSPHDVLRTLADISARKSGQKKYAYDFTETFALVNPPEKRSWKQVFVTDMEPSASGYRRLVEFGKCRPEGNNADIYRLLALQQRFDRDVILNPAFGYRFQFKEFVTRMDHCVNGLSKEDSMEKILEDMRKMSDRILRTEFRVRGYGIRKQPDKKEKSEKTKRNNKLKR